MSRWFIIILGLTLALASAGFWPAGAGAQTDLGAPPPGPVWTLPPPAAAPAPGSLPRVEPLNQAEWNRLGQGAPGQLNQTRQLRQELDQRQTELGVSRALPSPDPARERALTGQVERLRQEENRALEAPPPAQPVPPLW
ncbi:MAG: hypothetical protein KQJ78_03075 [Deltaproteobacteria bacterium]|nr:hypothetical protein [Deltaproteobacteria bacterium]